MRLKYYLVYPGILTVATAISEPGYSDRTARSSYDCVSGCIVSLKKEKKKKPYNRRLIRIIGV